MEIVALLLEIAIKQYKGGKVAVGDQALVTAYRIREGSWKDDRQPDKKPLIPPLKKT